MLNIKFEIQIYKLKLIWQMASVSAILSSDVEVTSAAALNCTIFAIESIAQSATSGFTCDRHSFIAVAESYSAMLQVPIRSLLGIFNFKKTKTFLLLYSVAAAIA